MTEPSSESGFTLVEVLVALMVFSLLSAATIQSLTSTLRARDGVDRALERAENVAVLDRTLRDDLANLSLRPASDAFGTPIPTALELYGPVHLLSFSRGGRANPEGAVARTDQLRVSYDLEGSDFIRRTPALGTPTSSTPVLERVLLRDVRSVDVEGIFRGRPVTQVRVPPNGPANVDTLTFAFELESGTTLTHVIEVGQ